VQAPGRATVCSRYAIDTHSLVIHGCGRIPECLLQIFWLKKWIFGEKGFTVGICCKQFQNTANRNPHASNARFAATLDWFNRYSIKHRFHVPSLGYAAQPNVSVMELP
jgi:hypothetical protein